MEIKKANLIVGHMSKADQEKKMLPYIKNKKFQVTVEIQGKTKYAYCDDLSELDTFIKASKGRIIEVVRLNE
jgi:hypothetical protein